MSERDFNTEDVGDSEEGKGGGLPIDLRAVALGFWQLRWLMVGAAAASIALGLVLALLFSSRVYTAQTVMLYQPPIEGSPEAASMPSLNTLLSLVKLASNLETVNKTLNLKVDIKGLGASTSVELQPKTTLVTITTKWDNAKRAAEIANGLREAFLHNQTQLRREESQERLRDLQNHLAPVSEKLEKAEAALRKFTTENRVVHLTEEARATLDELGSVNLLYEQAQVDQKSINLQAENTDRLVEELRKSMEKEQEALTAATDELSETNIRIQRLRESIMDDKEQRSNDALMNQASLALERAQSGFDIGAVSQADLDLAKAAYETIKAKTVDTPQIEGWKNEIQELDKKVIPSAAPATTVSGDLLKSVMIRSFEIKLQQTAAAERVKMYSEAKKRVDDRLARLPDLERTNAVLVRAVESAELEKKDLEARIAETQRLYDASALPFVLVAEAVPPTRSSSSNAKKLAAAAVFLLTAGMFGICLAVAVFDPRIRTRQEAERRLSDVEVLAEIPELIDAQLLTECRSTDPAVLDTLRLMTRRVRADLPRRGARILLVSPGHDEGTSTISANIAMFLGRWGEKVLLVDGTVRQSFIAAPEEPASRFATLQTVLRCYLRRGVKRATTNLRLVEEALLGESAHNARGLGYALAQADTPAIELPLKSQLEGVWMVPRDRADSDPDLLGTPRMRELVDDWSRNFGVVLIDSPPLLESVDALHLSRLVDGVVVVVRGMGPHTSAVREVLQVLDKNEVQVLGVVLNRVPESFATKRV